MKSYLNTHLAVALHAIIIVVVIIFSAWYMSTTTEKIDLALTQHVYETEKRIAELAIVTDQNGADALTATIIMDCPRRSEFDIVLGGLNKATKKELIVAQQLFESCGAFYSERKALMVAQLKREYIALDSYLNLIAIERDLTPDEVALREWSDFITLEESRSDLLAEQTVLQGDIITLLIEGNESQRALGELLKQAQNVNQSLSVTDAQIDALRLKLIE